jgi:hypothetical protein
VQYISKTRSTACEFRYMAFAYVLRVPFFQSVAGNAAGKDESFPFPGEKRDQRRSAIHGIAGARLGGGANEIVAEPLPKVARAV